MIRVLALIAVSGFLLCVACLSAAIAIGGPDALERGVWTWAPGSDWNWGWTSSHHVGLTWRPDHGPQATRQLAWSGGDALDIQAPADVTFTQGPGPASLTVTGPQDAVDEVQVEGGRIALKDGASWRSGRLTIAMTAPDVRRFTVSGAGKLDIEGYRRDRLDIEVSGAGDVTANGSAKTVALRISGSGDADLGQLKTDAAEVDISGSGDARIAPKASAKIDISGNGDVTLLTHPAILQSNVSGSGHVTPADESTPAGDRT